MPPCHLINIPYVEAPMCLVLTCVYVGACLCVNVCPCLQYCMCLLCCCVVWLQYDFTSCHGLLFSLMLVLMITGLVLLFTAPFGYVSRAALHLPPTH